MQPVLNVGDIKRVEIALTRARGRERFRAHAPCRYAAAQEALGMGGTSLTLSSS